MAELTTVARPYAKAAFAFASEQGKLSAWSEQLSLLAALVQDAEFSVYLSRPSMAATQQTKALALAAGESMLLPEVHNFLAYVALNKRLSGLPAIAELFEALKAEAERSAEVQVTSAYALTESQEQVLADSIATRLGRKVSLRTTVDAGLIGGVIVRTGDLVIDASVRGKLAKLSVTLNS